MNKNKVISHSNLPARPPIWQIIVLGLLLDRLNAPQWVWGLLGGFYGVVFIVSLIMIFKEEKVDIFKSK